jgi:cell pole-organizing protein PopZ
MMAATSVRDEPSMEEILASIRKIISEQEPEPAAAAPKPTPQPQPQRAAPAAAPVATAHDDVLELTTVLNDDGTITDLASMGEDMLADDFDSMVSEAFAQETQATEKAAVAAALEDVAADLADFSDTAPEFETGASEFGAEFPAAAAENSAAASFDLDAMDIAMDAESMDTVPAAVQAAAPASFAEALTPTVTEAVQTSILSSQAVDRSLSALSELRNAMHATAPQSSGPSVTLEDLTRELLRPMLKTWLDANLPTVVERIVKEEVRRITASGQ